MSVAPQISVATRLVQKSEERKDGKGVVRILGAVGPEPSDPNYANFLKKRQGKFRNFSGKVLISIDGGDPERVPLADNNSFARNFQLTPGDHTYVVSYTGEKESVSDPDKKKDEDKDNDNVDDDILAPSDDNTKKQGTVTVV